MDRISNVDQLVLLLRQTLMARASDAARRGGQARGATVANDRDPVELVRALASAEAVDERQLRRALVQSLLAGRFDRSLLNDAQFQRVVDRVTDAIDEDPQAAVLVARVLGTFAGSP